MEGLGIPVFFVYVAVIMEVGYNLLLNLTRYKIKDTVITSFNSYSFRKSKISNMVQTWFKNLIRI
jgi:hypothetical protein